MGPRSMPGGGGEGEDGGEGGRREVGERSRGRIGEGQGRGKSGLRMFSMEK